MAGARVEFTPHTPAQKKAKAKKAKKEKRERTLDDEKNDRRIGHLLKQGGAGGRKYTQQDAAKIANAIRNGTVHRTFGRR